MVAGRNFLGRVLTDVLGWAQKQQQSFIGFVVFTPQQSVSWLIPHPLQGHALSCLGKQSPKRDPRKRASNIHNSGLDSCRLATVPYSSSRSSSESSSSEEEGETSSAAPSSGGQKNANSGQNLTRLFSNKKKGKVDWAFTATSVIEARPRSLSTAPEGGGRGPGKGFLHQKSRPRSFSTQVEQSRRQRREKEWSCCSQKQRQILT